MPSTSKKSNLFPFKTRAHQCFSLLRPFWFFFGICCGLLAWWQFHERPLGDNPLYTDFKVTLPQRDFLFVAVLSYQQNDALRDAARRTWLKFSTHATVHRFFVGSLGVPDERRTALEREARANGDLILLENVPDSFSNRTFKLLQAYLWVFSNYKCSYVLKLNDNSFARVDIIARELGRVSVMDFRNPLLCWGFFAGYAPVSRSGPWAEPAWFLSDRYLPYACGGGYVLSWYTVVYIGYNSKLLDLYANDDVAVGVWLAPLLINRTHDRRFDTERESRGCFNSYLVTHQQTVATMEEKYKNLVEQGVLCKQEVQLRMSYVYNKKARLSLCCVRNISDIRMPREREEEKERQGG
ncbi:beta-1,3-galactosyltransferase 6-like [Dermacentor albipictus]|uniref:beta-1,3-galactosyltransferase 6-like n=1 Tax=Dermacentor albipictus TaxID=60249 RepID=UPI0031FD135A